VKLGAEACPVGGFEGDLCLILSERARRASPPSAQDECVTKILFQGRVGRGGE